VHNITTSISNTPPFHGVRARTTDDSTVVAWADDLSFAENPVSLSESVNALIEDVSNSSPNENGDDTTESPTNSSGGGSSGKRLLLLLLLPSIRACYLKDNN